MRGTFLTDADALALVRFADGVLRRCPEARGYVTAEVRALLGELNAAAKAELASRCDEAWRAGLVPVREAAQRLGVAPRTVRWRGATGRLAGEQDARGRWLVEVG